MSADVDTLRTLAERQAAMKARLIRRPELMRFAKVKAIEGDLDGQRRYRPGQVGVVRNVVIGATGEFTLLVAFDTCTGLVAFKSHEVDPVRLDP